MEDLANRLEETISRRDFTVRSAMALLSGVAITIVGCSDSSSPASPSVNPSAPSNPTAPNNPTTADVSGNVSANHGHVATITGTQLTAGNALRLDITGSANHPHTVELSVDELNQIANGQRVSKASSTDSAHNHTVTFN